MKKFMAILLSVTMLLGIVTVPAFAATTPVQRITDKFDTNNTAIWRADEKGITIVSSDGNNYAMLNSYNEANPAVDGTTKVLQNQNQPIAFGNRAICEFDFMAGGSTNISHLPFFKFFGTENGKSVETYELIGYEENKGNGIYVRQYSNVKPVYYKLAVGDWARIRIDADFEKATYRVYVNDTLLQSSTASEFPIQNARGEQMDPSTLACMTGVTIDTYQIYYASSQKGGEKFYIDNVDWRTAYETDNSGARVSIANSTVTNGETEVELKPQLSYTFSHELNPNTLKNISLNGDTTFVRTAELSADKKTLNIALARNLAYNTTYTLDFGFTEAAYGGLVTDTVTFSTLTATNLAFDDFEADTINSDMWIVQDKTDYIAATLSDDPKDVSNQVVKLENSSTQGARIDNFSGTPGLLGSMTPGDVLVEFDMMIDSASTREAWNFASAICSDSNTLMQFNSLKDDAYKLYLFNNGTYDINTNLSVNKNEWHKYSFVIDPVKGNFKFYFDGTLISDDGKLKYYSAENDYMKGIRFQLYNGNDFYGVYLDNIKIARNMWMTEGGFYNADGDETDVIDAEKTTYKATIINRAPVAENMKLYLATYTADGRELKDIVIKDVSVPSGKTATVSHTFSDLGGKAYTSKIKAIFVKDCETIEPYRAALGLSVSEILAGTAPEDVTATLSLGESVASVYPGGRYKAVTMRFDDGKEWDKEVLSIMNANGLKGTFYLIADNVKNGNTITWITADEVQSVYAGHEVGNHSLDHDADNISLATLTESREYLESVWGDDVTGFAYPSSNYGTLGEAAYKSAIECSGHTYGNMACVWNANVTTTVLDEVIDISDIYETTNSCRMLYTDFDEATKAYAANTDKKQSVLFTMQHAGDFCKDTDDDGKNDTFDPTVMNTFVTNIANRSDIWYCTNGELITYLMAQDEMNVPESGASATVNETTKTLYFLVGDELVAVAPGSRLVITEG